MFANKQSDYETPNVYSTGISRIPHINIPPIVYTNESRVSITKPDTKDIPPSSSFDRFMKSFWSTNEESSRPPVLQKVSVVKNNQGEFATVPYDSAQNGDFVEITGNPTNKGTMFYAKPNHKPATKSRHDDEHDKDDNGKPPTKDMDDYIFHMYVGSLSIIGLLILFRIIQKS